MTHTNPCGTGARLRPSAVLLLLLASGLGALLVLVAGGIAGEYGDTGVPDSVTVATALGDWLPGLLVVTALTLTVGLLARRSAGRRWLTGLAAAVSAATVVGVPTAAVLGVHAKYDRYPDVPHCTDGFTTGPAVPVTEAAQAAFAELAHPGPFSGGGSSGVDGCTSQLMVPDGFDPRPAYRATLLRFGWTIRTDRTGVRATRAEQRFELTRAHGEWWVWIGPRGLAEPSLQTGEVGVPG